MVERITSRRSTLRTLPALREEALPRPRAQRMCRGVHTESSADRSEMGQIDRSRRRRGCAGALRHKICTASLDNRPLIDGLFSCSIPPSFVLSHNMSMTNTMSNWLCFGAFHSPPVPSLLGIRWLLVTILSPHAPRLTIVGVRSRCRAPSWVQHSPPGRRQHATTCYVFRFWQKFSELSFRRKLLSNIDLRRFPC